MEYSYSWENKPHHCVAICSFLTMASSTLESQKVTREAQKAASFNPDSGLLYKEEPKYYN